MTAISTRELAAALGVTRQAVNLRSKKQSWQPSGQKVRGGGNTYDLDTLPLSDTERRKVTSWQTLQTLPATTAVEEALHLSNEPDPGKALALACERLPVAVQPHRALTERQTKAAYARYEVVRLYLAHLAAAGRKRKTAARDEFIVLYDSGQWPELRAILGPVSWKSIEQWKLKVKMGNGNPCQLADTRGGHRKGLCKVTVDQARVLRDFAFHPNKMKIAHAIRWALKVMQARGMGTVSEATCRRYLHQMRRADHPTWTFFREGEQALEDQFGYTLDRDWSKIEVGDVLTADGHVLNFQVLNPFTGKPCRPTLLLWYDCASNMPLGWEIMPTENTEVIHVALRRAIIALGKLPKVAYLDNGRAFKGKYFTGSKDFDDGTIAGLYSNLGITTTFATAYHGQSKPVERFFGTMLEVESLLPSYTGNSIDNKPARMHRGEKLHQQLWERFGTGQAVLTLEQTHMILAAWFDEYAARPQRGHLAGRCPLEVFEPGRGPGVDVEELTLLMMSTKVKSVTKQGVLLLGEHYYHPALYGLREPVVVRHDLRDREYVYIYRRDGEFLCKASPRAKVHPMARVLGNEDDLELLQQELAQKNRLKTLTVGPAKKMLKEMVLPEHQQHMVQIGMLPSPQISAKPESTIKVKSDATIQREMALLETIDETQPEDEYTPELVDESVDLERLSGADLYEALVEREARGTLTAKQQAQMSYYEASPEFIMLKDYYEEFRAKVALLLASEGHRREASDEQ